MYTKSVNALTDTRVTGSEALIRILVNRLGVVDLDGLHTNVLDTLKRSDISRVVLDLKPIDMVDTSFINVLRSLALRARKHSCVLNFTSVPAPLEYVLRMPNHRLRWAQGLLPNDGSMATIGYSSSIRRRRKGWRRVI
jgi:anti-anti-sigma regulatory factor